MLTMNAQLPQTIDKLQHISLFFYWQRKHIRGDDGVMQF